MAWTENELYKLYIDEKKSAKEIALIYSCSPNKVNYWLHKYHINKRSIAEAVYCKANPTGDPFKINKLRSNDDYFLFGLGLGLYWGEGTKRDAYSVRLGNTDPALIKMFLKFLRKAYSVDKKKLRFGLQIFSDMNPNEALSFWSRKLGFSKKQFQKVVVTPARSIGTYRHKTAHGVLTVYFSNKKLREVIGKEIEVLKQM